MGRSPCCEKIGLKKGPWTPEEDQKLLAYIEEHGHGSWRALPTKAGLQRCGKSCRLRWTNYLRPDIKRGKFSLQEEQTIIQLHALLGNRWSAIATHLPKRTDNEIKNYWNTHLKKRLTKMGIDPVTHKPKSDTLSSADGHTKDATNLSHMAQWESARLEAEARLVRESKLRSSPPPPSTHPTSSPCLDVLRAWQGVWSTKPPQPHNNAVDLDSPTSTLTFSETNSVTVGDEEDWKFLGKPIRGFNSLPALQPTLFCADVPWPHGSVKNADGFTDMLLENSNEGNNSSSEGYAAVVESDGGREEENKSYWNSILNLVNAGSSSGSQPLF